MRNKKKINTFPSSFPRLNFRLSLPLSLPECMRESQRVWSVHNSSTLPLFSHTFPLLWHVLQEKFSLVWALHGLHFLSGKSVWHGFFMGCRDICSAMKHLLLFWPRCSLWCFSLVLFPPSLFITYFSPFLTSVSTKASPAWLMGCGGSSAEPAGPCYALLMRAPDHSPKRLFLQPKSHHLYPIA